MASTASDIKRQALQRTPAYDATRRHNVGMAERMASAGVGVGMLVMGLKRGSLPGLLMALGGGALLYRGVTGFCHLYQALGYDTSQERNWATAIPAQQGQKVEKSITIHCAPENLYQYFSFPENMPSVFDHILSVARLEDNRTRWRAKGPLDTVLEWDAEIIEQRPNEVVSWRSLEGSEVETAGSVHFRRLPGDQGTELRVSMKYNPPGGKLGAGLADFIGQGLEDQLGADLERFKQRMEAGEITAADSHLADPLA